MINKYELRDLVAASSKSNARAIQVLAMMWASSITILAIASSPQMLLTSSCRFPTRLQSVWLAQLAIVAKAIQTVSDRRQSLCMDGLCIKQNGLSLRAPYFSHRAFLAKRFVTISLCMMGHPSLKQEPSLGAAWQSSTDTVADFFSLYHYYCLLCSVAHNLCHRGNSICSFSCTMTQL